MAQQNWKNPNFKTALKNSINGIKFALKNEKNFKIQLLFMIIVIIAGFAFKLEKLEWIVLIITIGIVLFAELVNTTIEKTLDLYTKEYNEKIKLSKDIASGAVLMTAIMSVIIGGILFLPKILNLLK